MTTTYEFVVETVDEYGDIIDCPAWDTIHEARKYVALLEPHERWQVALRRDTGNEREGLTERYYAYPDGNGKLPERMETCYGAQDGPFVPKKYMKMVFPVDSR